MTATSKDGIVNLYTASNITNERNQLVQWNPNSIAHDAMIQLDGFRDTDQIPKRIVAGSVDQKAGSNSIVLAFDDGTFEFYSPDDGSVSIGRVRDSGKVGDSDSLSKDDFRSGKFKLLNNQDKLVFFSNNTGILTWQLSDNWRTDPTKALDPQNIFDGSATNSASYLSADALGNQIATSHPTNPNAFVIWKLNKNGEYFAEEMLPFPNSETSASVDYVVEPKISPDGKTLALVQRFRNAYQVYVFSTSDSKTGKEQYKYNSLSRTSFGSLHFIDNQRILISEDRTAIGINRTTRLIELTKTSDQWYQTNSELPEFLSNTFRQVDLVDVALKNGDPVFAGFAIPADKETPAGGYVKTDSKCVTDSNNRELIAWNKEKILDRINIPFSRRIQPAFDDRQNLSYFVEGIRTINSSIDTVDLFQDGKPKVTSLNLEDSNELRAKRWTSTPSANAVVSGDDWFYVRDVRNAKTQKQFSFSLNNQAKRIELYDRKILIHHSDNSASLIEIGKPNGDNRKVQRMHGLQRYIAMSPDGKLIGYISQADGKTFVVQSSADLSASDVNKVSTNLETDAIALTWINRSAAQNLGLKIDADVDYALATLSKMEKRLELSFWQSNGKKIEINKNALTALPLPESIEANVSEFEFSPVSGDMISVIWDTDAKNRLNLWKFAWSQKPEEGQDLSTLPKSWFNVNVKGLGKVHSLHFGEVSDPGIPQDKIAPRLVISGEQQGSKYMRLYALELGLDFKTKPLLELTPTDKLQTVDEIVDAQFSGDGKTLVSITSERARIRLTDGWDQKKADVDFGQKINQFSIQREILTKEGLATKKSKIESRINDSENNAANAKAFEKINNDLSRKKSELNEAEALLLKKTESLKNQAEVELKKRTEEAELIKEIESEIDLIKDELEIQPAVSPDVG